MISPFSNLPVFIQIPKVPTLFLETQPSYTIGHIKTMIQEKEGIPPEKMKLVFADQLFEDGHTLSDYSIQDGSTIYFGNGRTMYVDHFVLMSCIVSVCTLCCSSVRPLSLKSSKGPLRNSLCFAHP